MGIGTTGPGNKLTVQSATQYDGLYVNNATNNIAGIVGFGAANETGTLLLKNTGTTNVFLTSGGQSYLNGGNVGIGTTTPDAKLQSYMAGT